MNTVNKDGKTYKATEREDGSILLEPIEESPKREPQCGDVRLYGNGFYIRDDSRYQYTRKRGDFVDPTIPNKSIEKNPLLLNIFDFANGEYVKKQDIIDALSHKDEDGENMIDYISRATERHCYGAEDTCAALRKLGII